MMGKDLHLTLKKRLGRLADNVRGNGDHRRKNQSSQNVTVRVGAYVRKFYTEKGLWRGRDGRKTALHCKPGGGEVDPSQSWIIGQLKSNPLGCRVLTSTLWGKSAPPICPLPSKPQLHRMTWNRGLHPKNRGVWVKVDNNMYNPLSLFSRSCNPETPCQAEGRATALEARILRWGGGGCLGRGKRAGPRTAARTTQRHMEANLFRVDMEKGRGTKGRI